MDPAAPGWMAVAAALAAIAGPEAGLPTGPVDVSEVGLSDWWLVFGFAAQGLFMSRFLLQWLVSERAGKSVVPRAFWWLSLAGGVSLGVYFLRRGDPVGFAGQFLGILIYLRNLVFIRRERQAERAAAAQEPAPG